MPSSAGCPVGAGGSGQAVMNEAQSTALVLLIVIVVCGLILAGRDG